MPTGSSLSRPIMRPWHAIFGSGIDMARYSGGYSTMSNHVPKKDAGNPVRIDPLTLLKGEQMDENTTWQKLAAEFLGTAFLVFVGVGSVPATLIVNGDAPFTMASLGMISLAFGTVVIATVYALGH